MADTAENAKAVPSTHFAGTVWHKGPTDDIAQWKAHMVTGPAIEATTQQAKQFNTKSRHGTFLTLKMIKLRKEMIGVSDSLSAEEKRKALEPLNLAETAVENKIATQKQGPQANEAAAGARAKEMTG